jgi:hypothetical protein
MAPVFVYNIIGERVAYSCASFATVAAMRANWLASSRTRQMRSVTCTGIQSLDRIGDAPPTQSSKKARREDMKANEFDALNAERTPGAWENDSGFVRSPNGGNRYETEGMTVTTSCQWVAECRDGEAFYNPKGNAEFIAWCGAHADLISKALHAYEALESAAPPP